MKLIRPISLNDASLLSTNVAETDHSAYAGGTTYAKGDRVIVVSTNVHNVFESLQGTNTGHTPVGDTNDVWWLLVGKTNRWKMFDALIGSQTTNPDTITVSLRAAGRIDSIALFSVEASSMRVQMVDDVEGIVFDETFNMVSNSGIANWYDYFFEPVIRKTSVLFVGLPPYANTIINVTVDNTGDTAACGECVLGLSRGMGGVQYGAQVGIQDYSIKQQDEFGNFTIDERAFSDIATFDVVINNSVIDEVKRLLASYRAIPIVYAGTDQYSSTVIYGFFKTFTITIQYENISICNIELEGLS